MPSLAIGAVIDTDYFRVPDPLVLLIQPGGLQVRHDFAVAHLSLTGDPPIMRRAHLRALRTCRFRHFLFFLIVIPNLASQ